MSSMLEDTLTRMRVERHAQTIFFEAMQAGYVNKTCEKTNVPELLGSKHILYAVDEWKVTDTYIVSEEGDGSGGMTVISYDDIPIWMMQYGGRYPKEAIPFLKEALAYNYASNTWRGGRGPEIFHNDSWFYINKCRTNDFGNFSGIEYMIDPPKGTTVGEHRYHGFWLMNR